MSVDTSTQESRGHPHAHVHTMWHAPCFWYAFSCMSFHLHESWHASRLSALFPENRRFQRFSGNMTLRPPAVTMTHDQHTCIIVHAISEVCASCHRACAHVARSRAENPDASTVRILACSLFLHGIEYCFPCARGMACVRSVAQRRKTRSQRRHDRRAQRASDRVRRDRSVV